GRQRSARSPGQAQELPVPAVYAVDAVRCARQGDGIAAADPFLQQAGCQRQGRVLCEEAVRRQQERCTLCLDCLQRHCLLQPEAGRHGAAEGVQRPAAAQLSADVMAEGADVGALGAAAAEQVVRCALLGQ
ncbi:hypothetical protein EJMLMN_EJMLMN_16285, partial [Dysosmobacter welbionis]